MAKTISSSTTGPVTLTVANNPLTITGTGAVTSTGGTADAIDAPAGATWTIGNSGKVSSGSGFGMSLASKGTVTNFGAISGVDGLVLGAGGQVVNNTGASITSGGVLGKNHISGSGVYITGASGTVTNSGYIKGVAYGVALGSGLITNSGTILGGGRRSDPGRSGDCRQQFQHRRIRG